MRNVLVSTVPFGQINRTPLDLLEAEPNTRYVINPIGRRLTEDELAEMIGDTHVLIAGTEPITRRVMSNATELGLIARVGIGLDNVDLDYAAERGIKVAYTPDAPSPAVAELAVGQMLNLLRNLGASDREIRSSKWDRKLGHRIGNSVVGIIGVGRIGSRVVAHLAGFNPKKILVNDLRDLGDFCRVNGCEQASKEEIIQQADILSLHVPLTADTRNLISLEQLRSMKSSAVLINTARGGIVNEADLFQAMSEEMIAGAALDVFEEEPYTGPLCSVANVLLTSHLGSCTVDCRSAMEIEAVEDGLRFLRKQPLRNAAPSEA